MSNIKPYIYKITNLVNGKIYIGQHIQHYFKLKEANLLTKRQKVISRLNIGEN